MGNLRFLLVILLAVCCFSCKRRSKESSPTQQTETNAQLIQRTKTHFNPVFGIYYTEVYRRFDTGLSFNAQGYQLTPSWKIRILSDALADVFSPVTKRFYALPLTLDHDSIFSLAGAFFKTLKLSKDSLKFQVLSVKNKHINWKNSNVYVTFYADDYLKHVLRANAEALRKPTARDTAYIRKLTAQSEKDSTNLFAAQEPVVLTSKSPEVKVSSVKTKAKVLDSYYIPETLFYPEYQVVIHHAYANFHHSFAVRVDAKGGLHFIEPMEVMVEGEEQNTIKVMKGLIDGYLKLYVGVTPGKTLGIPHEARILLNVTGYTN